MARVVCQTAVIITPFSFCLLSGNVQLSREMYMYINGFI